MRPHRIGAAPLIAALALRAGASVVDAAPPWSDPVSLPDAAPPIYAGGAVTSQDGMTLVHDRPLLSGKLVWLAADGSLARVQPLSDPLAAAPIEASPNRSVICACVGHPSACDCSSGSCRPVERCGVS